jgi:hypothetical protein
LVYTSTVSSKRILLYSHLVSEEQENRKHLGFFISSIAGNFNRQHNGHCGSAFHLPLARRHGGETQWSLDPPRASPLVNGQRVARKVTPRGKAVKLEVGAQRDEMTLIASLDSCHGVTVTEGTHQAAVVHVLHLGDLRDRSHTDAHETLLPNAFNVDGHHTSDLEKHGDNDTLAVLEVAAAHSELEYLLVEAVEEEGFHSRLWLPFVGP